MRAENKIAITGGPRTGKTTLAQRIARGRHVISTDTVARRPRPLDEILAECAKHSRYVLEGTQVPRVIQRGARPDVLLWLSHPPGKLAPPGLGSTWRGMARLIGQQVNSVRRLVRVVEIAREDEEP